jgi:hypothetical protein
MWSMTTAEQHEGMKRHEREMLCALIGEHVMHALGEPANLHSLVVRRLWKDHYRVNVFVGENVSSARIGNSGKPSGNGLSFWLEAEQELLQK